MTNSNALRRHDLPPKVRDRIEMVTLSDAGWSPPGSPPTSATTPRPSATCSATSSPAAPTPSTRPAPARPPTPTAASGSPTALRRVARRGPRPGPAASSAEALAERGIALGPRQVRRYLKRLKAGYRRTASTLKHKQDPAKAERAGRVLDNLKAKAAAGRLKLYYLDECGFSPTLPIGYSWSLPGQRKLVRYEAPQGRRVNALAAYRPYGRSPRLEVFTAERTWDSYDLLGFLKALPWSRCPRVVVLDNASLHTSKVDPRGPAGSGRLGDLPVLPAAVQPGAEPDRAGVPAGQVPGDPAAEPHDAGWAAGGGRAGFGSYGRKLRPKTPERLRPAA